MDGFFVEGVWWVLGVYDPFAIFFVEFCYLFFVCSGWLWDALGEYVE